MNSLIIVDIQNDFIPGGSLPVPGGHEVISLVNELQDVFQHVVATQDWHPANHKSFASNHDGRKPFDTTTLHGVEQVLWPDHCIQGSAGAEFKPELNLRKVQAIFRKGMDADIDSYSGFYDNGHKKTTGLAGYLRECKVKKVFICGLAADYCVFFTALDAIKENFESYIIEDATRPIDVAGFHKKKELLMSEGGHLVTSESIYRYL